MGARVLKLEQPGVGDYYRALTPPGVYLGGGFFDSLQAGHESIALDLKHPKGVPLCLRLIRKVDVVIESFRPGTLARWGLSFSRMKKEKKKIILCSITGYGQKGERASLAGHDLNFLARSGLYHLLDPTGQVIPDFQIADLAAGYEAALRIVGALAEKKRGGWIDVAMERTARQLASLYRNPSGESFRSPLGGGWWCYGIYPAKEGFVALGALEPKFWNRFCDVIGKPSWKREGTGFLDFCEEPAKKEKLREIFRLRSAAEWDEIGRREDVCLTKVAKIDDVSFPETKNGPRLGEGTVRVLRSLGYSPTEISLLRREGVIG